MSDLELKDKYRITNNQAQAKQIGGLGGSRKKKLAVSVERIADASLYLLQNDFRIKNNLDYYILREEAINELKKRFIKYKIENNPLLSKAQQHENKQKREIAIMQLIKEKIKQTGEFKASMSFGKFLYLSGFIKSEKEDFTKIKLSRVINFIKTAQENSRMEWKENTISDDFKHIYTDIIVAYKIPEIKISIDSSINEDINTLDDLINSKKRNKIKYIKNIEFTFSSTALASFVAIGRKYVELEPKKRLNYKISYSYRMESFIRSLEHVQYIANLNSFDLEYFNDMFNLSYQKFYHIFTNVIVPSIEEINNIYKEEFVIEYTIKNFRRKNLKQTISFFIKRKQKNNEIVMFDSKLVEYYIASRVFFKIKKENRKQKIHLFSSFLRYVENLIVNKKSNEKIGLYEPNENEPTLEEWEQEAIKAYEAQNQIFIYLEEHKDAFGKININYDREMMCFVEGSVAEDMYEKEPNIIRFGNIIDNPILSLEFLESELKWKIEALSLKHN